MVIENIDLAFGGTKAITDISFTVYKGEICAVIGPNGAGKSSMLNVINGVYIPQQGSVTYEGKKFKKMKAALSSGYGDRSNIPKYCIIFWYVSC